jgi:hypothetical protein
LSTYPVTEIAEARAYCGGTSKKLEEASARGRKTLSRALAKMLWQVYSLSKGLNNYLKQGRQQFSSTNLTTLISFDAKEGFSDKNNDTFTILGRNSESGRAAGERHNGRSLGDLMVTEVTETVGSLGGIRRNSPCDLGHRLSTNSKVERILRSRMPAELRRPSSRTENIRQEKIC